MNTIILAALLTLQNGFNNVGTAGEVIAIEAATASASATVEVKAIQSFTEYTNATADVISYEPAWAVTYTNFDGEASIETNVVGRIDYSAFQTNGVSKIIGEPQRFDMPITNVVVTAQVAAETYTATNDLATVNVTDHFGTVVTNGVIFGGGILVTGAAEGDTVKILIK